LTCYLSNSDLRCLKAFALGDLLHGVDKLVTLIEHFRLKAVEHPEAIVIGRKIIYLLEVAC
jgi:hypothetical protein